MLGNEQISLTHDKLENYRLLKYLDSALLI